MFDIDNRFVFFCFKTELPDILAGAHGHVHWWCDYKLNTQREGNRDVTGQRRGKKFPATKHCSALMIRSAVREDIHCIISQPIKSQKGELSHVFDCKSDKHPA